MKVFFRQHARFLGRSDEGNLYFCDYDEGDISRIKQKYTSKDYLSSRCTDLGFDKYIRYGKDDVSLYLWKAVIAFQDYPFTTTGHGKDKTDTTKFKYEVSASGGNSGYRDYGTDVPGFGNELWVTANGVKKNISRSTVDLAYRNALKLMEAEDGVKEPKALGIPGAASYLYPILLRFGVIKIETELV